MVLHRQQRRAQPQHRRPDDGGPTDPAAAPPASRPPRRPRAAAPRSPARASCIGLLVGASNFDIGHIALGAHRRRRREPRRRRRATTRRRAARACPTPIGDFFAVDYVAHEMGHQFAGNHTFNGDAVQLLRRQPQRRQLRSSRAAARRSWPTRASARPTTSQPHRDPYWSQPQPGRDHDLTRPGPRRTSTRSRWRAAHRLRHRRRLVRDPVRGNDSAPIVRG